MQADVKSKYFATYKMAKTDLQQLKLNIHKLNIHSYASNEAQQYKTAETVYRWQ